MMVLHIIKIIIIKRNTPLVDEWLVQSDYNGFCRPPFYIGKRDNDKEIWVTVRGSYSLDDYITDAKASKIVMTTGSYHKGFYYAVKNVWVDVNKIIKDYQSKDYDIIFTGHSYGGAVANVLHRLAYSCYPELKDRFYTITFGAPPAMGKKQLKKFHQTLILLLMEMIRYHVYHQELQKELVLNFYMLF